MNINIYVTDASTDTSTDASIETSTDTTLNNSIERVVESVISQENTFDPLNNIDIKYEKFETDNICCICFENKDVIRSNLDENKDLSLNDIELKYFENELIPEDILFLSCCNEHYICINCLRRLVNNYENHPINENNSHVYCPYPFKDCLNSMQMKNIFNHSDIKKIFKSEEELNNYTEYADQYIFPGYTIFKCPYQINEEEKCNSDILISNEDLKTKEKGEIVLQCDQNALCLKKFCFTCKKTLYYFHENCTECMISYENESPRMYNYFINKKNVLTDIDHENNFRTYTEEEYLYKNGEITKDIAINQIIELIENVDSYMICPICKISLYKTEKCNGLSHHNVERCYACGRIGYKIKGLGDHWSHNGINGCYRFDTDQFVKENIQNYKCVDNICSNHEKGDCIDPSHQQGINDMFYTRKKSYIYHILISLLPSIRYKVYDELYDILKKKELSLIDFLPYKQTLKILDENKDRLKDYTEDILYSMLNLKHPKTIELYDDKKFFINLGEYNFLYIKPPSPIQQQQQARIENSDEEVDIRPRTPMPTGINTILNEITTITNTTIENIINNLRDQLNEINNEIIEIINPDPQYRNTEPQNTESQNTEPQNTESQNTEPQNTESQNTEPQNTERRILILPPPPSYLRRQLYEYDHAHEDEYDNENEDERSPLIPNIAISRDIINNINGNRLINNGIQTINITQRDDGYILLDEFIDLINNETSGIE